MRALNILRHVALIAVVASGADAQTVAITGGTVYPVSGPRIENGTVLIRDGKIVAVGANVTIPADARRIDASGKWVTPGFIHAATNLGLGEAGSPQFSGGYNDGAATGAAGIAASFEAWKGINPANTFLIPQRLEGVTTIGIASGRGMVAGKVGVIDLIDANTAP
jgi:imidazolonepropionase-like amidohydrolase